MLRCAILLLLLFTKALPLPAQVISKVDLTEVKQRTTDPASPYYFPKLLARLQQADTTLRREDYRYLYYGQVFAAGYEPYGADEISKEFGAAYGARQNEEALRIGLPELAKHPFNLKLRKKLLVCYQRLGNQAGGGRYALPYSGFLYTILGSGDGHALATAFVTVTVADEYEVLSYYDLTWNKQTLQGMTDVFSLTGTSEPPHDEQHTFTGQRIYFDASRPLLHLQGLLDKKK